MNDKEIEELGKVLEKDENSKVHGNQATYQNNISDSEVKILQELAERREALEIRSREIDKKAIQLKFGGQ